MRPHMRVYESVCTRMYVCVYTCVSTPTFWSPVSCMLSLPHDQAPPRGSAGPCAAPGSPGDEAGGTQGPARCRNWQGPGCRAACRDSRLPDGPPALAGSSVSPGDPGAAGPRPAGPRGARLSQRALQPRPRTLLSGPLSPRAPRPPNCCCRLFAPHLRRLRRPLPPAPGEGSADVALRRASPVRPLKTLPWRRRTWDMTQKAPVGRPPTEWGCCPPLGRRCRPHPAGLGGGCEPIQELGA